jgi:hypothetical protein
MKPELEVLFFPIFTFCVHASLVAKNCIQISKSLTALEEMPPRVVSMRRRPWYVAPVAHSSGTGEGVLYNQNTNKILCGHPFNAAAERTALTQDIGEGEECCIAMEPIADARSPFSDSLRVYS